MPAIRSCPRPISGPLVILSVTVAAVALLASGTAAVFFVGVALLAL